jgi:hypothetical protein
MQYTGSTYKMDMYCGGRGDSTYLPGQYISKTDVYWDMYCPNALQISDLGPNST